MTAGSAARIGKELKLLRTARRWSQERLIVEMERLAPTLDVEVASRASLRTMVSNWENGKRSVGPEYQKLLAAVHGVSAQDLFSGETAGPVLTSVETLCLPTPETSPGLAAHLWTVLSEYVRADNLMGPRYLLDVATTQVGLIERTAAGARGETRRELLRVGTQFAEFAGWLHQDAGQSAAAQQWSSRALDYAHELGDPWLTSYVFMRKSNIATDAGDAATGLGLANAALREADRLTPGLRAVALRQRAHAHALAGEAEECARAVDDALAAIEMPGEVDAMTSYCTRSYVEMEAANAWVQLGRADKAVPVYERGLQRWPQGLERDRGLCLSRLAFAHADLGEVDQAAAIGG